MIDTFDKLYLEIAKLANKKGNRKLLMMCLKNRKRTLNKEIAAALTATPTNQPIED